VWAMDITYIPMARGFVYLAVVLDWFSRTQDKRVGPVKFTKYGPKMKVCQRNAGPTINSGGAERTAHDRHGEKKSTSEAERSKQVIMKLTQAGSSTTY
jgi:hypothetical protein